jgi:hypothetical protein
MQKEAARVGFRVSLGKHHKILRGDVPWINLLRKVDLTLILVGVEEHLEKDCY